MVNCKDTRKDFPMLDGKTLMHGKPLIYFDNGATTLKPQCVIDAVCEYYLAIQEMPIVEIMIYLIRWMLLMKKREKWFSILFMLKEKRKLYLQVVQRIHLT